MSILAITNSIDAFVSLPIGYIAPALVAVAATITAANMTAYRLVFIFVAVSNVGSIDVAVTAADQSRLFSLCFGSHSRTGSLPLPSHGDC